MYPHYFGNDGAVEMMEPLLIVSVWGPSRDPEITCVLCSKPCCTHELALRHDDAAGGRQTMAAGIHKACAASPVYSLAGESFAVLALPGGLEQPT
jgi:hypothetical protein